MLAGIRPRLSRFQSWVLRSGICILAGAGMVAVVAPMGAAASTRPAPAAKPFFSVAKNYTIRYYPRFMTYFPAEPFRS